MRRSKLGVLVRLAKLEERAALGELGKARAQVTRSEREISEIEARRAVGTADATPGLGRVVSPQQLRDAQQLLSGLRAQGTATTLELLGARGEEERARDVVARARLRVRALENAAERRAERERRELRRKEQRRIDELQRNRSPAPEIGETSHAPA